MVNKAFSTAFKGTWHDFQMNRTALVIYGWYKGRGPATCFSQRKKFCFGYFLKRGEKRENISVCLEVDSNGPTLNSQAEREKSTIHLICLEYISIIFTITLN